MTRATTAARRTCTTLSASLVLAVLLVGLPGVAAGSVPARRVVIDVVPCNTVHGTTPPQRWIPQRLPVNLPSKVAKKLQLYSNGELNLLGPRGYACSASVDANGSQSMRITPADGAMGGVFLADDYTAHNPGAELVCPYFPNSVAAQQVADLGVPCQLEDGGLMENLTPDIVQFLLPDGTIGVAIYPQAAWEPSVDVTVAGCLLRGKHKQLCAPILDDVLTRRAPSVAPTYESFEPAVSDRPPCTEEALLDTYNSVSSPFLQLVAAYDLICEGGWATATVEDVNGESRLEGFVNRYGMWGIATVGDGCGEGAYVPPGITPICED